jgi:hypothetical protein
MPAPPAPGPPCNRSDECDMLARPCEVLSCQVGRCDVAKILSQNDPCVGVRYIRLKNCMCDGESPYCISCDSSPTPYGIIGTPPANTPGAGVPVLPGMVTEMGATSDNGGPIEEESPGPRRSEGGITDTPRTTTPRKTKTMADDVQQDGDVPLIPIIAGSVVGCVALLGLIAAIVYFVSRRSRGSMPTTPHAGQSMPSPSSSSSMMASSTSEYGAAPIFPPSGEYGVAPALAHSYDASPPQVFANYESVRDPLQL